ncbi:hypothetical protein N0V93_001065 [Gnomoniopsis smithogilvyi]|uniref:Uncharacterized protein n=1 Tax=Gnomoniopsis smithogilvyi TaxID=1191159 RepID=A0A9W9D1B6_9PEZI|nr:hypothetical protein N0V93_001065 [Gnomoniopsis smithogilvyi]
MPSIDVAMARSVRGGVGGILARSLQAAFEKRSLITSAESNITSVKEAFSSWDNCMAAVYCNPPNGRRRKHLDEPYNNIPDSQGYKREDPMAASALPFDRPRPTTAKAEPPQYASFDVSKHADGSEDELPAMPVWGDAESKKIHLEEEAVELKQLKPPEATAPLMNGMSPAGTPGTRTPVPGGVSPYGPPGSDAASSGYFGGAPAAAAGARQGAGPYNNNNMPGQGYNQVQNAYGQSTTSFHTEQSWGVTPGPMPTGHEYRQGQGHPQAGYGQPGFTQEPEAYGEQSVYGDYGVNNASVASGIHQGYGLGPTRSMTGGSTHSMRNGAGYPDRSHGSPAPQQGQFGQERAFDPRLLPQRTASPAQSQGSFDPRLMPQRTGSPAQQQGAFPGDPRMMAQRTNSPAQQQGAFPGAPPPRTFSPAPQQQRSFSPGPQGQGPPRGGPGPRYPPGPGPLRQMSGDAPQGRGFPQRAPPYRQDSAQTVPPPGQRQQFSNSPRPGQQRMPPPRSQTIDRVDPPRSPGMRDSNFSRPMRSNTFDQTEGGEQNGGSAAYPGYKPYQPGR